MKCEDCATGMTDESGCKVQDCDGIGDVRGIEKSAYDEVKANYETYFDLYNRSRAAELNAEAKLKIAIEALEEIAAWESSHPEDTRLKQICRETLSKITDQKTGAKE